MKGLLLALLLAVGAGLGGAAWYELQPASPGDNSQAPTSPRLAPAAALAHPLAAIGNPDLFAAASLARPIFSPSRRPRGGPAAAVVAGPGAAVLPRMTGILVDGNARTAIFANPNGKQSSIAEGGHIGPFTIQSIEPEQVTVIGPQGKRVVRTSFDPNPPPVSANPLPLGAVNLGAPR